MSAWPIPCDFCGHVADSRDSYADSRADLAVHVHRQHPSQPLPGTWTVADVHVALYPTAADPNSRCPACNPPIQSPGGAA